MKDKILAIRRAEQFSPGNIDNDAKILQAVSGRLGVLGYDVRTIREADFTEADSGALILSMGRLDGTIKLLFEKERKGAVVVNTPASVSACIRYRLDSMMRRNGIKMPPLKSNSGYWIKRGDQAAQSSDDIIFVDDETKIDEAKQRLFSRGAKDVVVSANVEGDLVKFYGVMNTDFFRFVYPAEIGNGKCMHQDTPPNHYRFSVSQLRAEAERLASLVGIDVYGGDCIISDDSDFCIIDFNDWPSFASCREEAAEAIVEMIRKKKI